MKHLVLSVASLLSFHLMPTLAMAETEAERRVFSAPMPHLAMSARWAPIKVHRARLHSFFDGVSGELPLLPQLPELRELVRECMMHMGGAGKPPSVWPNFTASTRADNYYAHNRTIMYAEGLAYSINVRDCSLIETRIHTASLWSSQGLCEIDLIAKTASGYCDKTGHANARPAPAPALPRNSTQSKVILGLRCEVWADPSDPSETACFTTGGSFRVSDANSPGMMLELLSKKGGSMYPVEAMLDDEVNSAIFAPYTAAGFTVKNMGPRIELKMGRK